MNVYITIEGTEYDFTNLISYPFTINGMLDETLDTAMILIPFVKADYIAYDLSQRIERLSPVRIVVDGKTFRYLVSEDNVKEVKLNAPKLYSHNLTLIEPTKILEKRVLPNMTITQPKGLSTTIYSPSNLTNEVEFQGTTTLIPFSQEQVSQDTSIIDVRTLKEASREYTIALKASVFHKSVGAITIWIQGEIAGLTIPSLYSEITLPASYRPGGIGGFIEVRGDLYVSMKYTTVSTNEDVVFYVGGGGAFTDSTITVADLIISTTEETINAQVTMEDVANKILAISKMSDINDSSFEQEFTLDDETANILSTILSPELSFSSYTVWDALKEIGNVVKAIPRIGKTNFNTISFDFIDDFSRAPDFILPSYMSNETNAYLNDYVSGLEINAQNVTEIQSSINYKVEPYIGGWLSVRADGTGPLEIKEDTAAIKVRQGIYNIFKVEVSGVPVNVTSGTNIPASWASGTKIWDITDRVVEQKRYNGLLDQVLDSRGLREAGTNGQGNTLYYTQGSNRILGLNHKAKQFIGTPERALYEAIYTIAQQSIFNDQYNVTTNPTGLAGEVDDSTNDSVINFDGVKFRVSYTPNATVRSTVMRQDAREHTTEAIRYINESAKVIDSEHLGEHSKALANRLGNEIRTITSITSNINAIPDIGSIANTGEVVVSYSLDVNPIINTYSLDLYKDYAGLSNFVGVDSAYRQYQVPDEDVVFRQDKYREYMILTRDSAQPLRDWQEHTIYTTAGLLNLVDNFISGSQQTGYTPTSYGVMSTRNDALNPGDTDWTTFDQEIDLTINTIALGTTMSITVEMDDNYSAGPANVLSSDSTTMIQQDIQYADQFGQIDSVRVNLYNYGFQDNQPVDQKAYPGYSVSPSLSTLYSTIDMRIYKDARERLGYVQEINFAADDIDIRVYSGIAKYNGMSANKDDISIKPYYLKDDYFPSINTTHIDRNRVVSAITSTDSTYIISDQDGLRVAIDLSLTLPANTSYTGYALIEETTGELIYAVNESIVNSTGSPVTYSDIMYFIPNKEWKE